MSDSEDEDSPKEKQIGDYLINEELGSGGFGKVVSGTHIPTGEKVAIKIMDKEQIMSDELNKERVLNEISILKIVRHNNIVKLYEVMETPQKIYLVMEYCDSGDMFDYIVAKQHLSERQACVFFQEIIDALSYLHSQNIVHRDVKPENILLQTFGKSLTCKLIDFGISRTYTLDKLISTPCGTASYAPPEMHKGEEYYGLLSDVWSAGVLLYAMVCGYLPFCEEDEDTNIDNIIKGNYEIPEEASPDLKDLIKHIMDIDPLTRYDIDQIKKHPWYNLVTPPKCYPGLIIGYHKIPIDERILKVCEAYGFNKDEVEKSVKENKYDNKSSIYYIILSKMKREGYDSISDLFSQEYLNYINDKDNLIEQKDEDNKDNDTDKDKQKGLELLQDVLKGENVDNDLSKNNLEQISRENIKNNEGKDEVSVASEKKKNNIMNDSDLYSDNDSKSENQENNKIEILNEIKDDTNKNDKDKDNEIALETLNDKINKDIIINNKEENEKSENSEERLIEIKQEESKDEKETKIQELEITESKETEKENKEQAISIADNDNNVITLDQMIKGEENPSINEISEKEPEKKEETPVIEIKESEPEKKEEIKQKIKQKEDKDKNKNKPMIPQHSFYINISTKKMLNEDNDIENENPNKLNSSFTQKLTDTLKENVFKMRNPKVQIENKEQKITNALKEIKQNKVNPKNKQNKNSIAKNKKIKKIVKEPLFKGTKKNEHTIIHNRNASAVNERRKENKIDNEKNQKNKRNKNTAASVEKKEIKYVHDKNTDLKYNIKKVKINNPKEKKDKNTTRENSTEKRKNLHTTKKYNKFINKNSMTIKKNENDTTINTTTGLMTNSNIKHNKIKSFINKSTNKKNDLKTPSKNLNKTNFEPLYKKINNSNITKTENLNKSKVGGGALNKALQLSEVKENNKMASIKKSNYNYKKNIRLAFKNIADEDFIKNEANKTVYGHNKVKSDINLYFQVNNFNISNDKNVYISSLKNNSMLSNKHNNNSIKKRKIHYKSNSMEVNNPKKNRYISNHQNILFKNNNILNTERSVEKTKKFINIPSYDGPLKTEMGKEKNGIQKFWKNKQGKLTKKECWYKGPVDLKNIFFGNSPEEIEENLVGILIKNRIKFWKMNSFRYYCKKNGESFIIRIYVLNDKLSIKNKEDIKVSEFEIDKKNNNNDKNEKYMIFYVCVLSKDSNNKTQSKQINKIINKKFSEIFNKNNSN